MNDTIGGQVPISYDTVLATTPQHNAGRVRALAVTSIKRSPLLPNIPTLAESGFKDFNIVAWNAVVGPKGLPADVKAVLQKALKAVIEDPAVVEKMAATGFDISWNPANDWAQMIRAEIAESKDIAAKAKIKIEPGTQSGKMLRLKGKGLPVLQRHGIGDLFIHINVWTPKKFSKEEKDILEKLKGSENFKPNPDGNEKGFFQRVKDMFQ